MVRLYVNVSLVVSMMIASDHSAGWELYRLGTRGSAYERGLQHGRAFREQIHRDFEDEEGWGHKIPVLHRKPEILAGFMKRLRALPHGQELIEEMQGIAEAARMPFADIAAKNLTIGLGRAHGACSTAILPSTEDGPILINTLDGFPNSRHRRTYPCMVQVAYPTVGQPMAFLGNVGTVWAHRGMNASGLAMGACSGGIGAPRGGINYEGMYYALLSRYALQFHRTANETIELFTANRQLSKGINVSVLDATGDGAIMEYSAFAVGVRRAQNGAPLYATNFFQTDRYPPYSPAHEKLPYMVNARARYRRFAHLLSSTGELDLDFAQGLVHDTNDGKEGQICQDNTTMYTTSAGVYHCRGRTAYAYLTKPTHCEPWVIKLDPVERSASGPSAPANEAPNAAHTAAISSSA